MALADRSVVRGSAVSFFDPNKHLDDLALIIEPKAVRRDVQREDGKRDEVLVELTVFRSQAQLDGGKPHEVKTCLVTPRKLVRDLDEWFTDAQSKGDANPAFIVTVGKWPIPGSSRKVWVWKQPTDDAYEKAAAYYNKREAEIAAALEDVPDF